jgi:hypothetical protein
MPAIAADLNNVLAGCVRAMIAAIFGIVIYGTTARAVCTFIIF